MPSCSSHISGCSMTQFPSHTWYSW